MAKRRSRVIEKRRIKSAARYRAGGGESEYAKKKRQQLAGNYRPGSPFYLSPERQAEAIAAWETSGRLPSWARWVGATPKRSAPVEAAA